jgi:putative ABC transport system permease protein
MIRFALKGLLTRKLRTALTAIAIVLGVATVSGTFVLTDSIDKAFDSIFTDVYKGTDATITSKSAFSLDDQTGTTEAAFDASLLDRVRELPDVADAIGGVATENAQLVKDGKAIVLGGAPYLGL